MHLFAGLFAMPVLIVSSVFGNVSGILNHVAAAGYGGNKVTICHKAGNHYNQISINANAIPAHQAHGDIVPMPAGGCPAQV